MKIKKITALLATGALLTGNAINFGGNFTGFEVYVQETNEQLERKRQILIRQINFIKFIKGSGKLDKNADFGFVLNKIVNTMESAFIDSPEKGLYGD
ncbi:MAG: hypothetical protein LBH37_04020 [Oscillospiraceae bacterium]|jgi:hypothetical protein|nr:hypothetical protein [Oscillospiraceae bacterium]